MLSSLFASPLDVGTEAPDFSAACDDGRGVTLSELRGSNVVLVFYPGDDTPVCTRQLCEFRDGWEQAKERNVLVFGVNPGGAGGHRKFREKFNFPFPLIVDEGRRLAKLYRADGVVVRRTVYLIGPDGRIRYARRGKPGLEEVLAAAVSP